MSLTLSLFLSLLLPLPVTNDTLQTASRSLDLVSKTPSPQNNRNGPTLMEHLAPTLGVWALRFVLVIALSAEHP
eukprot:4883507-Amphidinium_carterae.1